MLPIKPRLIFDRFGKPEDVLRLEPTPQLTPQTEHLLLRMHYAPINPSDLIPIHGHYAHRIALPQVPGYEGVGSVYLPDSRQSRRALAIISNGSWQTEISIDSRRVVWVPDDIDDVTAAQIYINPLTCWVLLNDWLALESNNILLLNGGGSALSLQLTQLAALKGIKPVITVRSLKHRQALLAAGAWQVIEQDRLSHQTLQQLVGHSAQAAIDCVGGDMGSLLARSVIPGGEFVALGLLGGEQVNWQHIAHKFRLRASLFHLRKWNVRATPSQWQDAFRQLFQLVRQGLLILPPPAEIYPLKHYKLALQRASRGIGKVFLTAE